MGKLKIAAVKKFYLLEYFYVFLQSVKNYNDIDSVFNSFKNLKGEYKLGESKYKKLTEDSTNLTSVQYNRYIYTFLQVFQEAKEYGLYKSKNKTLRLTELGYQAIDQYVKNGSIGFNRFIFNLMENKYKAYQYLINFCHDQNKLNNGLIILPNYSPLKLGFVRQEIRTTKHIINYSKKLSSQLAKDISEHLGKKVDLSLAADKLIMELISCNLLSSNTDDVFKSDKYNAIINRFRKYWLFYFLKVIYNFEYTLQTFDIWTYRGKQIGLLHSTEFFPNFSGKIVYPLSIITDHVKGNDFSCIYEYEDGNKLFVHEPQWKNINNSFIDSLIEFYLFLRKVSKSTYINISDLRELVCYKLKISEYLFDRYLEKAYRLNIAGELGRISISLEADKLPEETNAMYLKREPVLIDGKYRNIIYIDVTGGHKNG